MKSRWDDDDGEDPVPKKIPKREKRTIKEKAEKQAEKQVEDVESTTHEPIRETIRRIIPCRSVENYKKLNRIDEGTYGIVYRAQEIETGQIVALKKLKLEREKEGFPITALREISTLLQLRHPNIVNLQEIVVGSSYDSIFMVFEFVEHDLKGLMEDMKNPFLQSEVKTLMLQLLSAVHTMHENWIIHRDLKTSNLLMNNRGIMKVADYGLARKYSSPVHPMTQMVVTLWYRAPELLLGSNEYTTAVDMWSVGCIFAELINKEPLLCGKSELDQIDKMFKLLGVPNEDIWPGFNNLPHAKKVAFSSQSISNLRGKFAYTTEAAMDLLKRFLTYDPKQRITAAEALEHPYFKESPLPKDSSLFPTWPSRGSEEKKRYSSPSAPLHLQSMDEKEKELMEKLLDAQAQSRVTENLGFRLKF